ncbi:alpha/beta hydrolase family protein [Bacillus massilinigeriensis]|uniref:alpha/beta hydrolase family protein n=1 Tax=Bacillus mediterraneensis TaxID=1805474 RepID=UPI0008F81273|nr:S9 family peptidase [Bacillus mediterraneensis]
MKREYNYFQEPTASNPAYAPDGKKLRFIADYDGQPQIWELDGEGGKPVKITFSKERITLFKFIGNSGMAILGMDADGDEKQQLFLLKQGAEPLPLTDDPQHVHHYGGASPDGRWIAWSSNRRNPAFFDIYIQNLASLQHYPVFIGDGTYESIAWSLDGKELILRHTNSPQDHDIGVLNISTGKVRWLTLHKGEAGFKSVHFSRDASKLYLLTNIGREFYGLASLSLASGEVSWLCRDPWDYEGLVMNKEKTKLAFSVNEGGVSRGVIADLLSGRFYTWDTPVGVISDLSFSSDGKKLAYAFSGPGFPQEIWRLKLSEATPDRLTDFGELGEDVRKELEHEMISYRTFDGMEVPAFLYRPSSIIQEPLPAVIYLHGGPESQSRASYSSFVTYLVRKGYVVCAPNFRGSTGYGKSYTHLDDGRKRMNAVSDIVFLAEWLKSEGSTDPARISLLGGSYGGFLVLAALTHYPQLWASGISIVGISSIRSFLENTSPWRRRHREAEYGTVERDGDFFDRIDPVHHTDRIRSPLMLIHGANDPRVPIGESEQMAAKLRARHHPVTYIRFEDEGHSLLKMKNKVTAYSKMGAFLERINGLQ